MEQVQQFLPFILMFVVIYFFMIRPQQKRVKQEKQFEADIKVGDKIVTKSGIHAKISELNDTTIIIETCLLYTSPSPRDRTRSRMPSSA